MATNTSRTSPPIVRIRHGYLEESPVIVEMGEYTFLEVTFGDTILDLRVKYGALEIMKKEPFGNNLTVIPITGNGVSVL